MNDFSDVTLDMSFGMAEKLAARIEEQQKQASAAQAATSAASVLNTIASTKLEAPVAAKSGSEQLETALPAPPRKDSKARDNSSKVAMSELAKAACSLARRKSSGGSGEKLLLPMSSSSSTTTATATNATNNNNSASSSNELLDKCGVGDTSEPQTGKQQALMAASPSNNSNMSTMSRSKRPISSQVYDNPDISHMLVHRGAASSANHEYATPQTPPAPPPKPQSATTATTTTTTSSQPIRIPSSSATAMAANMKHKSSSENIVDIASSSNSNHHHHSQNISDDDELGNRNRN